MTIQLTPHFWDCECDERYIHHHSIPYCARCETFRDAQPDSRVEEVAEHLQEIFAEVFQQFTVAVGDILEVERSHAPGMAASLALNGQTGDMPAWAATVLADRLAHLRALQREDDEDGWLESAYEDRFYAGDE